MEQQRLSRRSFLQLTAGSVAMSALVACAAPVAAPAGGEEGSAAAEAITLSFLNRGGQFIEDVMGQQMDLYRESNPDVNFEINAVAGASHQEMLLTMIASNTGPDIWFDANRTTGPLTRRGVTLNLEPFIEADANWNDDDFVDNVWIAQTYDGARWGLPWDSGSMLIGYNKALFDEVGLDHPQPIPG